MYIFRADTTNYLTLVQILEGYNSQIQHLAKEMEQLKREFAEWEESKKP